MLCVLVGTRRKHESVNTDLNHRARLGGGSTRGVCRRIPTIPPPCPPSPLCYPLCRTGRTWWNDEVSCPDRERGLSGAAIPSDSVIHSGYLRHPPYFLRHLATHPGIPATATSPPFPSLLPPSPVGLVVLLLASYRQDTRRESDDSAGHQSPVSSRHTSGAPKIPPKKFLGSIRSRARARPIQILSLLPVRRASDLLSSGESAVRR